MCDVSGETWEIEELLFTPWKNEGEGEKRCFPLLNREVRGQQEDGMMSYYEEERNSLLFSLPSSSGSSCSYLPFVNLLVLDWIYIFPLDSLQRLHPPPHDEYCVISALHSLDSLTPFTSLCDTIHAARQWVQSVVWLPFIFLFHPSFCSHSILFLLLSDAHVNAFISISMYLSCKSVEKFSRTTLNWCPDKNEIESCKSHVSSDRYLDPVNHKDCFPWQEHILLHDEEAGIKGCHKI